LSAIRLYEDVAGVQLRAGRPATTSPDS
jgi:hypothetical protein